MKSILTAFVLTLSVHLSNAQFSFTQASGSPFTFNNMMRGAVAADVNGDGNADLLMGSGNSLYVGLGNGNGTFSNAAGSPITMYGQPLFITVADFNGDSKPDFATADYMGHQISVMLGTGTGSFNAAPGSPISCGSYPYCVAAADFNMDGKIDLISTSVGANQIELRLGTGTGSFSMASGFPISAGGMPYHVSAEDFNADSYPDFAFVNGSGNSLQVMLGNGSGGFSAASGSPYLTGSQPRTIAIKDLDNNGTLDLVIPNHNSDDITVMIGQANGSFTAAAGSPLAAGTNPYQAAIADFDLDGTEDIAFTNAGSNQVILKSGLGNGTFTTGTSYYLGSMPQPICTGDFDNNNQPDLAVGDWLGSDINILINNTFICPAINSVAHTNGSSGFVTFSCSSSYTGSTTTFNWAFGDGSSANGVSIAHTYTANGTYVATLTITDQTHPQCTGTQTLLVNITNICMLSVSISYTQVGVATVQFSSAAAGTSSSVTYSWSFGDSGTGTGNTVSHTYTANGTYLVTHNVSNLSDPICQRTATMYVMITGISPVGIAENEREAFRIYPNPVEDVLMIKSTADNSNVEFRLYSMLGQEILRKTLDGESTPISLESLRPGIYLFEITSDDNVLLSRQLIKISK